MYFIHSESGEEYKADVIDENVVSKSKYLVRYIGKSGIYSKSIHQSEKIDNKEILATYTLFAFSGGWAERFLAQFSDAGIGSVAWCENIPRYPEVHRNAVVSESLKLAGEE